MKVPLEFDMHKQLLFPSLTNPEGQFIGPFPATHLPFFSVVPGGHLPALGPWPAFNSTHLFPSKYWFAGQFPVFTAPKS